MNEINIEVFKDVIKKSTLNMALEFTRIQFKDGKMYAGMNSGVRDIVTIINMENNLITLAEGDELQFDLGDLMKPVQKFDTLMKYTQTIMDCKVHDGPDHPRIILNPTMQLEGQTVVQNHVIHMLDEATTQVTVLKSGQKAEMPYFCSFEISEDHVRIFEQVKSSSSRYSKIYIKVKDNQAFIDSTDANNPFEDAGEIPLTLQRIDHDDILLCYDFKIFCHLLEVIKDELMKEDSKVLIMDLGYLEAQESGVIHVLDVDKTEEYFLFSREL